MSSQMQRFSTCDFRITPQTIEFLPQEYNDNGNDFLKFLFSERSTFANDYKFQLIQEQNTQYGISYICEKVDGEFLKTTRINNLNSEDRNIIIKQMLQFIYLCNKNFHLAKCSIDRIFYSQQLKKIYIIEFGNLTRYPVGFQNQQQDSSIDLILAQKIIKSIQQDASKILNNFSNQTSHQEFFQFYCGNNYEINSFYRQNTFNDIRNYIEQNNYSISFLQYSSLQYSIDQTKTFQQTWDHHVFLMNFFDKVLKLVRVEANQDHQKYVYVYIKYTVLTLQKYLINLEQIKNDQNIDEKINFIFDYDIDWVELIKNNFQQFQKETNYKIEMHKNQQNYEIKNNNQLKIPETLRLDDKIITNYEKFLGDFANYTLNFFPKASNLLQFYLYLTLSIRHCFKAKYIQNFYGEKYNNWHIIKIIQDIEQSDQQWLMNINQKLKKIILK